MRRTVSVAVRPSRIRTVRGTCSETTASWVTTTIVVPVSAFTRRRSAKISADVAVSSSPVGSSARMTAGAFARATAIATRCCSPPDSRSGRWSSRSLSPTSERSSRARVRRSGLPSSVIGSSTFSIAVRYGSRFCAVCCQTMPTTRRR